MVLMTLAPGLCDLFQQAMLEHHWEMVHQDAGQTHWVGWGYEMTWKKEGLCVTLRYFNKQGVVTVFLEVSSEAQSEIQSLIKVLHEGYE